VAKSCLESSSSTAPRTYKKKRLVTKLQPQNEMVIHQAKKNANCINTLGNNNSFDIFIPVFTKPMEILFQTEDKVLLIFFVS